MAQYKTDPLEDRIILKQGDITLVKANAIVNAANNTLLGGGGVDRAIHRAAGPELLAECRTLNGCKTGDAKITKGYNLPSSHVIHTVGPVYPREGPDRSSELLSRCYRNCFEICRLNRIKTVAFPAISCGVYGFPVQDAALIALGSAMEALKSNPFLKKIFFILFSKKALFTYQSSLRFIVSKPD